MGPVAGGDGEDVEFNDISGMTHTEVIGGVVNFGNLTKNYVSVVAYDFDDPDCSPHPFDLMANNAL